MTRSLIIVQLAQCKYSLLHLGYGTSGTKPLLLSLLLRASCHTMSWNNIKHPPKSISSISRALLECLIFTIALDHYEIHHQYSWFHFGKPFMWDQLICHHSCVILPSLIILAFRSIMKPKFEYSQIIWTSFIYKTIWNASVHASFAISNICVSFILFHIST